MSMHQPILRQLGTNYIWCITRYCIKPDTFFIYINDLDTNLVIKMSKFTDDTKLRYRARNLVYIMELQKYIS